MTSMKNVYIQRQNRKYPTMRVLPSRQIAVFIAHWMNPNYYQAKEFIQIGPDKLSSQIPEDQPQQDLGYMSSLRISRIHVYNTL